jgi:predicted DNA-binding transcriptional regulator AlpA
MRRDDRRNAMLNTLQNLPSDVTQHRVLDSKEAAAFLNLSVPHFRRLYRAGAVPKPLAIGARKLGWRCGDLVAWLDQRAKAAAA